MLLSLEGFTVAVTADRRWEEQAVLLEREGAAVVHAPCIRTLPLDADGDGLRRATESLLARPPDVLVGNTAIGIRGWFEAAAAWGIENELHAALAGARVLARGPKVAGALAVAGLEVAWRAPSEQLDEIAAYLSRSDLRGLRVAVQLHGDRCEPVSIAAAAAGAEVVAVPVYRWDHAADAGAATALVAAVAGGRVDAVTFTAAPAVRNFFALAEEVGERARLLRALQSRVAVACVGPVCARAAAGCGVDDPVVPARARLGSMVRALADRLAARRMVLRPAAHGDAPGRGHSAPAAVIIVQGSAVDLEGTTVRLTEREREVLDALGRRPGVPVSRRALLCEVWGDEAADPHVVDVTVARLRRKLGPAGRAVQTVVRRGYRLDLP